MDWSRLPDLAAVILLACAFAAVARRSQSSVSSLWLTGWVMIALHFAAFVVAPAVGRLGAVAAFIGLAALTWAGTLFNWSSVPYHKKRSSVWMTCTLMGANTLYIALIVFSPAVAWAMMLGAALFGILPLTIALLNLRTDSHPLRWVTVVLYAALSIFLLVFQLRPGNGGEIALNAVLFTVFFSCGIHFLYTYRGGSTGGFITIAGFLAWASLYVVAPGIITYLPDSRLEGGVWNLPKFVVAVGMILLFLEEQIEHNKYLALHDELTGLPNRRLFQDRLSSALERARRAQSNAALLLVDLDQFKQVNDAQGHHVGDQLLKHVGKVFSDRVRRSDTVARTGGDEFSVILHDPTSREDAERVGSALVELLMEPFELGNQTVRIGASVGIAVFPEDASDEAGLCIAADKRMYDFKKRTGRISKLPRPPVSASLPRIEMTVDSGQAG